ncbi:MAG TPA: hypothetical protein VK896_15365 [Gaiellaceae bacterium]|nr:hypothetical protein [Gaiellaceae bacterium]
MSAVELYLRLAVATALVLAPGWLLARALGVRGVAAMLAWALTLVFAALTLTFALSASLLVTIGLLVVAGLAAFALLRARRGTRVVLVEAPGRGWAVAAGAVVGVLLWRLDGIVQGDGLFHLARTRKLLAFDELTLERIGEFADASLHPGYAFPLWHGFLALVARIGGVDPEQVVLHLPSLLAPLAVVVAYEAGWALFRRRWAAGAVAGAQLALVCFAPGFGGAFTSLALPATSSSELLVFASLALALSLVRDPSLWLGLTTAASALVLAVVHPTYALFLWIPFAGFVLVRALWAREDVRSGTVALGALVLPSALFMLWLLPVIRDTASVSPASEEVQRALRQYGSQLTVRSETSYSLAAEVFTRRGAVAIAALLLIPLAALAARRRWAAYVVGGSLAVFAVLLVPFLFTSFSDLVSVSQARRLAAFLPAAFAFAGGLAVLSRLLGPWLLALAPAAGVALQWAYPGDFGYVLREPGPALVTWIAVLGAVAALLLGVARRGPPLESPAGVAAALFLAPVFAVGLWSSDAEPAPPGARLTPGLVEAVRSEVPVGAIVYSDPETSYRLAAFAPVYVAVAPPGHVADTEANRPYERARDARRFLQTSDLAIPESYGADYLVVDRRLADRSFDLPVVHRDGRFTLYRLEG